MAAVSLPSWLTAIPPATRYLTLTLVATSTIFAALRFNVSNSDLRLAHVFRAHYDGADAAAAAAAGTITTPTVYTNLMFPWLTVIPGSVVWFPWTLLTAGFVETNLIEFIVSVLSLVLSGKYLERVWGQIEFLKFVVVVVVASNIIAVVVNVLEFSIGLSYGGDQSGFLYGMSYNGMMALQTAFLVAFTQLIPEHQVQLFGGLIKMRVKQTPMIYVTLSNILCVLGYQSPYILIQFGWLVSWFYLRFIKWSESGDTWVRGDRSETFSFASWFPPFLQRPIGIASKIVFDWAVKLHVLKPWPGSDIEGGGGSYAGAGLPGGARAEAERRRAMALKALDQRMASTKPSGSRPGSAAGVTATGSAAATATSPKPTASALSPKPPPPVALAAKEDVVFDAGDIAGASKEKA